VPHAAASSRSAGQTCDESAEHSLDLDETRENRVVNDLSDERQIEAEDRFAAAPIATR
jgi:hypothetical protein